ncbi:hypothetical protein F3C99_11180 [Vitellibacter sp. q18]|nr:hypothetical protein [Aequorivita lutea]
MYRLVNLDLVCEVIAGQSPPSSSYNQKEQGLPFFQGKADFNDKFPSIRYWCREPTKVSVENDILISVRAPVGAININNTKACIGRGLAAIRCGENVNLGFLFHYLKSQQNVIEDLGTGSTFKAITIKTLKSLKIPLPPLKTQIKIAEILDNAAALRDKTAQLLKEYDLLAQSIFLEMFGNPVKNPLQFEEKTIKEVSSLVTKGSSPNWQGYEYLEKGVRFVTSENVRLGHLDCSKDKFVSYEFHEKLKRSQLKKNDLLVNLVGASIGRGALANEENLPANINQAVAKVEPLQDKINPVYLLKLIITPQMQARLTGNKVEGARANISLKDVRELKIIYPSINLQNQFAEKIALIEQQKELAKQELKESEDLFNCLLQKAFKGELVKEEEVVGEKEIIEEETSNL